MVAFGENGSVAPFTLTLVATAGSRAAFGITVSSSASPCALIGATSGSTGTGMQVDGQKMEVAGKLMVAADADFGFHQEAALAHIWRRARHVGLAVKG